MHESTFCYNTSGKVAYRFQVLELGGLGELYLRPGSLLRIGLRSESTHQVYDGHVISL